MYFMKDMFPLATRQKPNGKGNGYNVHHRRMYHYLFKITDSVSQKKCLVFYVETMKVGLKPSNCPNEAINEIATNGRGTRGNHFFKTF